jgi:hypothetical protein
MARGISPCHALDGDDAPLGDQSAYARRGPPHGGELRQAAGAGASVVEGAASTQPWPLVRSAAILAQMPASRRFPPPWMIEEHNNACFIVKDATGRALGYFYFEEEPVDLGGQAAHQGRRAAHGCKPRQAAELLRDSKVAP